mgnify:CR=1 FL=1
MSGTQRMLVAAAATVLLVAPLATTASVAATLAKARQADKPSP